MRFTILVVSALALVGAAACELLTGSLSDQVGTDPTDASADDAASPDARVDDATGSTDPCQHVLPPPPPAKTDDGGIPDQTLLVLAWSHARVAPKDLPHGFGYDLDERCTGDTRSTTNQSPCVGVQIVPDGDGGVDDSFGSVLSQLTVGGPDPGSNDPSAAPANDAIEAGVRTVLLLVTDYNGGADDTEVKVAIVSSEGLQTVGCDGGVDGGLDGSAAAIAPAWDGCDSWGYVPGTAFVGITTTTAFDAYVSNHVLVARPGAGVPLAFGLGPYRFVLDGAVITATLQKAAGGGFTMTGGIVAGRMLATDVLRSMGNITNAGTPLCQSGYAGLIPTICAGRDIPSSPSEDGTGVACDALSLSVGFEAQPARVGTTGNPYDSPCPATANPTCP